MRLFNRLRCDHIYKLKLEIHGDNINKYNGKRSIWECIKCGKKMYSGSLVNPGMDIYWTNDEKIVYYIDSISGKAYCYKLDDNENLMNISTVSIDRYKYDVENSISLPNVKKIEAPFPIVYKKDVPKFIPVPMSGIGDLSDGYHTLNELYHHRAVLLSLVCNSYERLAWKSKFHSDGTMYDGMFIVGINTPDGPATYHYDIDPYWDMFDVRELPNAPEWDGHTPDDDIRRITSLKTV